MPQSSEIFIADTTCLILLHNIEELNLLFEICEKIYITPEIHSEYRHILPSWIKVLPPKNKEYQAVLETKVDKGEASAMALSLEFKNPILIIDDLKARKLAKSLNIEVTGTFGLFLAAKQKGLIKSIKPIIKKIESTNFRFSLVLIETLLTQAGEQNK